MYSIIWKKYYIVQSDIEYINYTEVESIQDNDE